MIICFKFAAPGLGVGAAGTASLAAVDITAAAEGRQDLPDSEEVVSEESNVHLDICSLSVWIIMIHELPESGKTGGGVRDVQCGATEGLKRNTLWWSGHTERMESEESVKEVEVRELEASSLRGQPLGGWRNKVEEYMCGGEGAMRACLVRERWRLFCCGHPLGQGQAAAGMHDRWGMAGHDERGMPMTCFCHAEAQVTYFSRGFLPFLWCLNRLPSGRHFRCSAPQPTVR